MSAIFISHSSKDNEAAAELRKLLEDRGYHSVFLDFDPEVGIPAGREWQNSGVWVHLHRVLYDQARRDAGRPACPSVVIMDGQSVKTTERGGARGFDAHKRVKGRERHILVAHWAYWLPTVSNRLIPPIGVRALCCLAD